MEKTLQQYQAQSGRCRALFLKKTQDYGTAWRILRLSSVTDQLMIKAWRIRNIETAGVQKIADNIESEFIGLVNYGIMALMQLGLPDDAPLELETNVVTHVYDGIVDMTRELMQAKNHDYGEVWRDMRVSSMTDLILMKLLRIKQIEDNKGTTIVSEGLDANYQDIINYALFALIKLDEQKNQAT